MDRFKQQDNFGRKLWTRCKKEVLSGVRLTHTYCINCIIIIYIDDMLIIGKEEAIDDAIKVLQGHFQVKDPTSLEDYLGLQILQSDDGKKAWLGQPTIIKSLEKQFGEKVAKKKMAIIPGTPGLIGGKVDDISRVDEKTQSMYRSGVGTLLYLKAQQT